jgi:hypothetical protein
VRVIGKKLRLIRKKNTNTCYLAILGGKMTDIMSAGFAGWANYVADLQISVPLVQQLDDEVKYTVRVSHGAGVYTRESLHTHADLMELHAELSRLIHATDASIKLPEFPVPSAQRDTAGTLSEETMQCYGESRLFPYADLFSADPGTSLQGSGVAQRGQCSAEAAVDL